jgi:hypothetical protein
MTNTTPTTVATILCGRMLFSSQGKNFVFLPFSGQLSDYFAFQQHAGRWVQELSGIQEPKK